MCLLLERSVRRLLLMLLLLNLHHHRRRCLNRICITATMRRRRWWWIHHLSNSHHRYRVLQRGRIRITLGDARPLLVLIQILEREHGLGWLGSSMMLELSRGDWLLRVVSHMMGWVREVGVTQ